MSAPTNTKRLVGANLILWAVNMLYTASPIDLLPDFIPLLGWADDGAGWVATLTFTAYTLYRIHKAGGLKQLRAEGPPAVMKQAAQKNASAARASDIPGYEPMSYEELRSL